MQVNDLILIAVDYFDNISIDPIFRSIKNVIRDINSEFRGLYKTITIIDNKALAPGYNYKNTRLTGTIAVAPAIPPTDPSVITGTSTLFLTELSGGDYIAIGDTIYQVNGVTANGAATLIEAGVTIASPSVAYLITDFNTIVLSGAEKTLFDVTVDDVLCKEVKDFTISEEEDLDYIRVGFNELQFNYLPSFPKINLRGLFSLSQDITRESNIEIPLAWESVLTNGLLFYLNKMAKYRDTTGGTIYGEQYYRCLADFGNAMNQSLPKDNHNWNYHTLSIGN